MEDRNKFKIPSNQITDFLMFIGYVRKHKATEYEKVKDELFSKRRQFINDTMLEMSEIYDIKGIKYAVADKIYYIDKLSDFEKVEYVYEPLLSENDTILSEKIKSLKSPSMNEIEVILRKYLYPFGIEFERNISLAYLEQYYGNL